MTTAKTTLMFVAGDPSGDMHAAPIIKALHTKDPHILFTGIGGPAMSGEGFVPLLPFEPFNKMGFIEVVKHLPFFLGAQKILVSYLIKKRPSALVCVDYPGFNIPLAKKAHKHGIPVIWYIAPQVWAWKPKRATTLMAIARFIGVVFPFETEYFSHGKAKAAFVGHPLIESLHAAQKTASFLPNAINHTFTIALIPGSRKQEILRNLAVMVLAAKLFKKKYPNTTILISCYKGLSTALFDVYKNDPTLTLFTDPLDKLLSQADFALVTSGTATLQTALAGVPHVIVYKTSHLTYSLMKRLVTITMVGLPNIVAQKRIVPEALQADANPQKLCEYLLNYANNPAHYEEVKNNLLALRTKLGSLKPSEEMCEKILEIVHTKD